MRAALLYPLRLLQPRPPPLSFNHPLPRTTHPFTWMNIDRHPTWNSPAARKKASFSAVTKATTLHVIVYSCARNAVPQFTGTEYTEVTKKHKNATKGGKGIRREVSMDEQLY
ncbi:uncharacterized protein LOC102673350 isoform X2 [Apis dorsata]|uniref:uncharacterized protein LOC102673350 isoform X2 n=1 Tax=Apis dorsata TaxID=7462 RepID=UPI0003DF65CE|nr:uncharacterized protein LOC102673350 isoform X2 [Apis dorsata]